MLEEIYQYANGLAERFSWLSTQLHSAHLTLYSAGDSHSTRHDSSTKKPIRCKLGAEFAALVELIIPIILVKATGPLRLTVASVTARSKSYCSDKTQYLQQKKTMSKCTADFKTWAKNAYIILVSYIFGEEVQTRRKGTVCSTTVAKYLHPKSIRLHQLNFILTDLEIILQQSDIYIRITLITAGTYGI